MALHDGAAEVLDVPLGLTKVVVVMDVLVTVVAVVVDAVVVDLVTVVDVSVDVDDVVVVVVVVDFRSASIASNVS